jgi:putative heme iron utilization protein
VSETTKPDPARTARLLLRAARAGSLATVSEGQPFASLITPATAPDGSVLMLLSGLSPHTRHLRVEQRCSVMVMGAPTGANPQTAPRLSLIGAAVLEPDPALKARWVALHPYAAFYAGLGDFQLWRFRAEAGQFVGGFASAHRLSAADLAPDPAATAALAAAEASIIAHCHVGHAETMNAIAHAQGAEGAGWQMVACDPDGCDLAREETVVRVPWSAPADGPGAVRAELVRFAAAARNPIAPASGPSV